MNHWEREEEGGGGEEKLLPALEHDEDGEKRKENTYFTGSLITIKKWLLDSV